MRLLKSQSLLSLVNSYVVDSPQPANLSYMWNFGSLLALCLGIQIVTGVLLAMHYTPNVDLAFISVEHIMRDVNYGWMIRYIHANVASFFFIFVYLHIARGLYYGSYKSPRVLHWSIGVIILVLMMAIAFLGYLHSQTWLNLSDCELATMSLNAAPLAVSSRLQNILRLHNLSPVKAWENLDQTGVKEVVKKAIRSLAGIYVIINLVNGDMYAGSAVTGRMFIRFHKHLYSLTGSVKVAAAVRKYGLSNFAFIVIEVLEPSFPPYGGTGVLDNKLLLSREQYYIDTLPTEYNIALFAGNTKGVLHTEQTKAAMRKNYSDERREMIGSLNRGKTLSPETIELIRLASLNRSPMSDNTRALVSANSAKAQLYTLSRVDGASFSSAGGEVVFSEVLRTLPVVAGVIGCGEKTVRRAVASNGIVKKTWQVTLLGKANSS
jgi:group I intron endonuclease